VTVSPESFVKIAGLHSAYWGRANIGVLNLRTQNIALLMKYLFKFMNKQDIPWVNLIWRAHYANGKIPQSSNACGSFWWRDCLSLLGKFIQISSCNAGPGNTVRICLDAWDDTPLRE
jgi:hypothetical protein